MRLRLLAFTSPICWRDNIRKLQVQIRFPKPSKLSYFDEISRFLVKNAVLENAIRLCLGFTGAGSCGQSEAKWQSDFLVISRRVGNLKALACGNLKARE